MVNIIRCCKYSQVFLMMGENCPKHVELTVPTHPLHKLAATVVNVTRCCKYSQVFLMMGENIAPNMWS